MCPKLRFDYLKSKQAMASGVLQQNVDNIILYISEGLHPPHLLLQILGLSLLCWHNIENNIDHKFGRIMFEL